MPLFLRKIIIMAERKSSANYWLRFTAWVIVFILFIVFYPQFLWIALPGIVTNFALALDLMDVN